MIKFGTTDIGTIYHGTTAIAKAYHGTTAVFGAAPAEPDPVTFNLAVCSANLGTTQNSVTGVNVSPADASRIILVGLSSGTSGSSLPVFTGVTIGGVSATLIQQGDNSANTHWFYAEVPTGDTVNISWNAVSVAKGYIVYSLYDADPSTFEGKTGTGTANPNSLSFDIAVGDAVFVAGRSQNFNSTFTWSGATERGEALFTAQSGRTIGTAADVFDTAQTGRTFQVTSNDSSPYISGVKVSPFGGE